jgi:hypothetical protein
MRVLRESNADAMVACFLQGELSSERFGQGIRNALLVCGQPETLLTRPDLADQRANEARRALLAATRGYGEDREIFEHFPATVPWVWARLTAAELAQVRYIEYSYWNEISGGTRLAADAAKNIRAGVRPYGVSNQRFIRAARAAARGALHAAHPGRPWRRRSPLPGRQPPADRPRAGWIPLWRRVPGRYHNGPWTLGAMSGRSPRLMPLVRYADATARVEDVAARARAPQQRHRAIRRPASARGTSAPALPVAILELRH